MGPFETIDLNAPGGVPTMSRRYQRIYQRLFPSMQRRVDWSGQVIEQVEAERRASAAGGGPRRAPALARPPADGAAPAQAERGARDRRLTEATARWYVVVLAEDTT